MKLTITEALMVCIVHKNLRNGLVPNQQCVQSLIDLARREGIPMTAEQRQVAAQQGYNTEGVAVAA